MNVAKNKNLKKEEAKSTVSIKSKQPFVAKMIDLTKMDRDCILKASEELGKL